MKKVKQKNLRILIVSRYFFPNISPRSYRATELAKELSRNGHKVEVLIPKSDFSYAEFSAANNIEVRDFGRLKYRSLNFGSNKFSQIISKVIFRILNSTIDYPHIELYFKLRKYLLGIKHYDLLISIARPHPIHWGVAAARRKNPQMTKIWIADCGDPFMGNVMDSFQKFPLLRIVENKSFEEADYITIPIEGARNAYAKKFHNKIMIIPQGFEFKDYPVNDVYTNKNSISFAYAGRFIPNLRDPRNFLEYLNSLNIDFTFNIFNNQLDYIKDLVLKSKGRVIMRDIVPREDLIPILKSMDFLVNFDNNTVIHSPSKLIDYAMTGLPILNIRRELEKEKINEFLRGDYSHKFNLPNIENYDIANVSDRFLDLANG